MSAHEQAQMISTRVHGMFGIALMGAGAARVVEIAFVDGRPAATSGWADAWRMLTPFVRTSSLGTSSSLCSRFAAGPHRWRVRTAPSEPNGHPADPRRSVLFMSATDEELAFVSSKGVEMDHETYILLMFRSAPSSPLQFPTLTRAQPRVPHLHIDCRPRACVPDDGAERQPVREDHQPRRGRVHPASADRRAHLRCRAVQRPRPGGRGAVCDRGRGRRGRARDAGRRPSTAQTMSGC